MNAIEAMAPASTMPRPSRHDPLIMRSAAEKLAVECAEWCGNSTAEEWVDDLVKCRFDWSDGYRFAKELEDRCYVTPDSQLVEILDSAYSYLSDAHRDAVKKWVQIVGFAPAYEVGDVVACPHGVGPVHSINPETAEYVIDTKGQGNGGYVIAAEDVRPASGIEGEAGDAEERLHPEGESPAPKADAQ